MESWLAVNEIRQFIGVNRYKDVLWFNKEAFEEFLWLMNISALVSTSRQPTVSSTEILELVMRLSEFNRKFKSALKKSRYQVTGLIEAL